MSEIHPDETLLVARAVIGDDKAFEALVHHYTPRLLWYVRRLGLSEAAADDVVQNAWLACWSSKGRLRDIHRFRAWLYGIARNKAFQNLGSINPREILTSEIDVPDEETGESFFAQHLGYLNDGLARLPILHREVLSLRFLEGMPYAEIAEATGVSVGTVKSRLHNAKAELRRHMEVMINE